MKEILSRGFPEVTISTYPFLWVMRVSTRPSMAVMDRA